MIPEKLAKVRFYMNAEKVSLNNILYQLGLRDGDKADELGKLYFFRALEAYQMMGHKDQRKIERKGKKIRES